MPSHSPATAEENEAQTLERSTVFESVVVVVGSECGRNVPLDIDLLILKGSLRVNWGGFLPCFAHILGFSEIMWKNFYTLHSDGYAAMKILSGGT